MHSDHHDDEGKHPADNGGPPAIDLGPTPASDQPHHESKSDIDPNVDDGGNKSADANTPGKTVNPDTPTTALPNPGPDPEAGKGTPDTPIFLGPSNNNPPPGSNRPSDAPQKSDNPGDEGRYGYTDDTPCGGLFDEPLINLLSNNGGDGGDASSGAATRQEWPSHFMSLILTRS